MRSLAAPGDSLSRLAKLLILVAKSEKSSIHFDGVIRDLGMEIRLFSGNSVVPIQSVRKFGGCKLKVNHSPRFRDGTRRRRVKKQRAHDQCSPFGDGAGYRSFLVPVPYLFCRKPPFAMRTGDYAQRPVVNSAFI
jgi:hypothetical protein